ncbi:MAG TPA: thioredoxin family protein [Chitinophagaceae bacterium]|nr:thioredoxin family protein [Chitinophagaceae bacterium]
MKKIIVLFLLAFLVKSGFGQDLTKFHLYNPDENAETAIAATVKRAAAEKKNVLIQVGGNWCIWCARFYEFVGADNSLDSLMGANYVVYHLNWSKENKNLNILARYSYPQRFGYPVFLILDGSGKLLHTQNSWYLEAGKSYDKEKVEAFFKDWGPQALDPAKYKEE